MLTISFFHRGFVPEVKRVYSVGKYCSLRFADKPICISTVLVN